MAISRKKLVNIHSSVENKQPSASALEYGEIAVNYAHDKEFLSFKNANDDVVRVSTDGIQNKRMESKEVVPVSGSITNVDKANNKSELVIKLNQWVGEGTPSAHELNYGTDSKGVDIAPGFSVDMSAFALNGGNGNFESLNVKCNSTLEGTTKIKGPDASHTSCGNKLEVSTSDTAISGNTFSIANESGITISNKSNFDISGATLNIKENNVNITGASTINGSTTINGDATVTGSTSLKATTVGGALNVTGDSTLSNTTIQGTLGVSGAATLGSASVGGNLNVSGSSTLQSTTMNNATVINGLTVNGASSLNTLTVNGSLNTTGTNNLSGTTLIQSGSTMYNILDLFTSVETTAANNALSSATFATTSTVVGSENGQTLTLKQKNGTTVTGSVKFDNALNATSVNAVQNKVVYQAYEELDCGKIDTTGLTGDNVITVSPGSCRTAQLSHKIGANAYSGDKLTVIQTDAYGHIIGLREATDADLTASAAQLKNLNIMYGATTASTTGSFTRDSYTPYNGGSEKNLVVPQKVEDLEGGATVQSDMISLKSDMSTAKSDITNIKSNVNVISGSVSTLTTNVSSISNKVDTISGSVNTVSGNVTTLNNSLTSLTQTVNTVKSTTDNLNAVKTLLTVNSISSSVSNQVAPSLSDGQDALVIYKNTGSTDVVVSISSGIYSTPDGKELTMSIPAGGYSEVSYLKINGEIFARGV